MQELGSRDNVTCLFVHIPTNAHTTPEQNRSFLFALLDELQRAN